MQARPGGPGEGKEKGQGVKLAIVIAVPVVPALLLRLTRSLNGAYSRRGYSAGGWSGGGWGGGGGSSGGGFSGGGGSFGGGGAGAGAGDL